MYGLDIAEVVTSKMKWTKLSVFYKSEWGSLAGFI